MKPQVIDNFKGEFEFLSNFYREDESGLTNEHRFQAWKGGDDDERAQIMAAGSPQVAKKLGGPGGCIKQLPDDWDKNKPLIMLTTLREKFSKPDLREKLIATGYSYLIEGNNWHDQEWGDCRCAGHRDTPGQNLLGRALMHLREELRMEQRYEKDLKNSAEQAWRLRGAAWGFAFSARMYSENPELSEETRHVYRWAETRFLHLAQHMIDADEAIGGYGG